MAIFFLDSFSHYQTPQLYRKWTTPNAIIFNVPKSFIVPTYGRCGQSALHITGAGDSLSGTGPVYVTAPRSAFCVGAAVKAVNGVQGFGRSIFRLNAQGGIEGAFRQLELVVHTDLTLEVGTGTASSQFAANVTTSFGRSAQSIHADSWHYVELVGTISATVGTVQLWVDGALWLDLTGLNTDRAGSGTWASLNLGAVYGHANPGASVTVPPGTLTDTGAIATATNITTGIRFSDFYLGDATTDRKGDSRVFARFVSGDGAYREWTPLSGTSESAMVSDNPPDDDLTYTASSTAGQRVTFPVQPISIPSGLVYAVQVAPLLEKEHLGTRKAAVVIVQGGVATEETPQTIADGQYLYYPECFELDPAGEAWTIASSNAAEYGVDVNT